MRGETVRILHLALPSGSPLIGIRVDRNLLKLCCHVNHWCVPCAGCGNGHRSDTVIVRFARANQAERAFYARIDFFSPEKNTAHSQPLLSVCLDVTKYSAHTTICATTIDRNACNARKMLPDLYFAMYLCCCLVKKKKYYRVFQTRRISSAMSDTERKFFVST